MSDCFIEKYKLINQLVTNAGFSLQIWESSYQMAFWIGLGTTRNETEVDFVRQESKNGNLDIEPPIVLMDWLPYATGSTMEDAMNNLEERLSMLPENELPKKFHSDTKWKIAVQKTMKLLKKNLMSEFEDYPETFFEAFEILLEKPNV